MASPPLGYLKVFEYLGLDPTSTPFHPLSSMAGPGRPNYAASREAIRKAWVSRIRDLGIVETTPCEGECEVARVANAKESFLTGRVGETVFEEGIIHALAGLLLEDDTRSEYVNHVLPVLRPPPPNRFGWGSGSGDLESYNLLIFSFTITAEDARGS
ncbi:hypothetical protein CMUS01_10127 [Colletotrichum musicola]|uniref:Uncharacterized protein n=1 Tax=Colletotrichum musicola TaxID=2175873 RepID=A0A8H6K589_9PEZI|nr:hypothetical protein CMUS01_10127 [Colletotrichum musicola]